VVYISTEANNADIFTKALPRDRHSDLKEALQITGPQGLQSKGECRNCSGDLEPFG
jgi:hypothetical protein